MYKAAEILKIAESQMLMSFNQKFESYIPSGNIRFFSFPLKKADCVPKQTDLQTFRVKQNTQLLIKSYFLRSLRDHIRKVYFLLTS